MHTTDGGKTWQSVSLPASFSFGKTLSTYFTDPLYGWILVFGPDKGHGPKLYMTRDGTKTWAEVKPPCTQPGDIDHFSVVSSTLAWWLCDHEFNPKSNLYDQKKLFRSVDGGFTWQVVEGVIPNESYTQQFTFFDSTYGWLSIDNKLKDNPDITQQEIYATRDGGKSWQLVSLLTPGFEFDLRGLRFVSPTFGYAIGENHDRPLDNSGQNWAESLFLTKDGGKSWQAVYP